MQQNPQKDKHAQIIDAAFENAIKLYHVIEREKELRQAIELSGNTEKSDQEKREDHQKWLANRKLMVENEMNAVVPIAEAIMDKMIQKRIDLEIKLDEIRRRPYNATE